MDNEAARLTDKTSWHLKPRQKIWLPSPQLPSVHHESLTARLYLLWARRIGQGAFSLHWHLQEILRLISKQASKQASERASERASASKQASKFYFDRIIRIGDASLNVVPLCWIHKIKESNLWLNWIVQVSCSYLTTAIFLYFHKYQGGFAGSY